MACFFHVGQQLTSLILFSFSCSLIPTSGVLLAVPNILCVFFTLEYLINLKELKNSQVSNDYNTMTITTNHV